MKKTKNISNNEVEDRESISNKDLLNRQGSTGWLILFARKHTYISWIFAFSMLLVNVAQSAFYILRPLPTIMVNEQNQIIGQYDYLDPLGRSDEDLKHSASLFVDGIISTNASTIFKDRGRAMDMMSPEYKKNYLKDARDLKEIVSVRDDKQKSFIEFKFEKSNVKRFGDYGENAYVRVIGIVEIGNLDPDPYNFDITVELTIVPKTRLNRYGVEVINYVFN